MDIVLLKKLLISLFSILGIFFISHFIKRKAKEISQKKGLKNTRYFALKRFISFMSLALIVIVLTLVWGVNLKNLWISVAGILAMIAVTFFAVWSLVGNILAGLIIYFTTPFKINDTIEILPDAIKGKVLAINTFYTLISDEDDNYINVPNSLFFQKYIRNFRKKPK